MTGMNMDRFEKRQESVSANSGMDFADIPKLVVQAGAMVRLVGDFESVWEHFVTLPSGMRPFYCEGPDGDCPLCSAANELCYSEDEKTQEIGKQMRAKEKFYFNCLDRSPVGKSWHQSNKKAKILSQSPKANSIGSMLFRAIGKVCEMLKAQGRPTDPNGYDICLSKEGSGFNTKYGAQFTGITDPLTDEEKAYDLWPLADLARITPRAEREVAANTLLGRSEISSTSSESSQVDPSKATATSPTHAQTAQTQQDPPFQTGPAPASAPTSQPAPASAKPVASDPDHKKPLKLTLNAQKSQYQNTLPTDDADPASTMVVPCPSCGVDIQISLEDSRDMQCHSCKEIISHPNNG